MKSLFFILILLIVSNLSATIINVPADQQTIQAGINVAVEGDTVLVQPGSYVENINFIGNSITVASLFLTTQDTTFISQTIIDGNQTGSVVTFESGEDSTAVLCGFTVTNGEAEKGGGVYCYESSPFLINLLVHNNIATSNSPVQGGGIYCCEGNPVLNNLQVYNNDVIGEGSWAMGGGIYCNSNNPVLENIQVCNNTVISESSWARGGGICVSGGNAILDSLIVHSNSVISEDSGSSGGGVILSGCTANISNSTITENSSGLGGGLFSNSSFLNLQNVSINENFATEFGGGIYLSQADTLIFHNENRCSIYSNYLQGERIVGKDIYRSVTDDYDILSNVIVDTFTVLNPTAFYVFPIANFTFDINCGVTDELINSDLYVSPLGDNSNSGLNENEPLKTVQYALSRIYADSLNQNTIWLAPGLYSPQTTEDTFPLDIFSNVLISGDSTDETIIDAGSTNTVIRFLHSINSGLSNLTIRNGYGGESVYDYFGGGITCINSPNPIIENVKISNNISHNGSGIYCYESDPSIINVTISENSGQNGGGIYCKYSNPFLRNVNISDNTASRGGGVYLTYGSIPFLENVTIANNSSTLGGGIYLNLWANIDFHEENRSNIHSNSVENSRNIGNDIYHMLPGDEDIMHVVVDTFSVINPTDYYVHPIEYFTFDIQNAIQDELINADLYVSVDGDNSNSGLTEDEPFKTIQYALARIYTDEQNPHTIFLAPGLYSPETNGEFFPLEPIDDLTLSGYSASETVLDASSTNSVIRIHNSTDIVIKNITIENGEASYGHGGGIFCNFSNLKVENVVLKNNNAERGGGMFCTNSETEVVNTLFHNNTASHSGGAIYSAGNISFNNTTFTNNTANVSGGWLGNISSTNLTFTNCISYYNDPQNTYLESGSYSPTTVTISYSNVQGGASAIEIEEPGELQWLEGNINSNPLFFGTGENPYSLLEESPCIDTGIPDTLGLNLPPWDIIGNLRIWDGDGNGSAIIDMGAYEYGSPPYVDIEDNVIVQTPEVFLHQNYPNPFNPTTTISFSIPAESEVELSIYNIKGQKIRSLLSDQLVAGEHSVIWNGEDASGKKVGSGVYLYKLIVNDKTEAVKKCLLLK